MVYVFVALYPEAKPIICQLGLKQEKTKFRFPVYTIDKYKMKLVVTGSGMVAAATAVGSMLAHSYIENKEDNTLINFGSCAGKGRIGETYLCNKIIDRISGHTFYPDMVYRHNYLEKYIITEPDILKNGLDNLEEEGLHDMEAAAIYQAGSYFLEPQKMSFIKVISDFGQGKNIHAKELTEIMKMATEPFLEYLMECMERDVKNTQADKQQIREQELEDLCQQLHCSQTMRTIVGQCIKYWSLAGIDYPTVLRQMREQKKLPCENRREGKKRLEELKRKLL